MGAGQYYLHDKGASTCERVGFTHTENIPTRDPHKAMKWMAWTAINAEELKRETGGATWGSCQKPVYTFSLAWHPEEQPKKWEMIGAGRQALMELGLQDHETVMASHTDREHAHLHLIVNVVHPETGKASRLSYSRLKLSEWAEGYERQRGNIYCDQRVENNAKRAQGEKVKYREPELDIKTRITELYQQSDSAQAFQAALQAEGFQLAQGKRLLLLDREGKIHSLYRQIEGVKAKDVRAKLDGLDLPSVDHARQQIVQESAHNKPDNQERNDEPADKCAKETDPPNFDRDQQDREWQESIINAAIEADEAKRTEPKSEAPPGPSPSPLELNALQAHHHAELGRFYAENIQAKHRLDFKMDEHYGAHEQQLRADITHLEDTLGNSPRLRVWWLKLTGQIPRNAEGDLQDMRRTLENIEWRQTEARQAAEHDVERRRQAIEARQRKEREELQPKLVQQDAYDHGAALRSTEEGAPDEDLGPSFEY